MRIRKIIAILICIILAITICACDNQKDIKSELIGVYTTSTDMYVRVARFDEDGTYLEYYESTFGANYNLSGTYEVQKDKILVTASDGNVYEWTYVYNEESAHSEHGS